MRQKIWIFTTILVMWTCALTAQISPEASSASSLQETSSVAPEASLPPVSDFLSPKRYIVNQVKVLGVEFIDPSIIAVHSGLTPGDTITIPGDYISSAIRKLWSSNFYSDVKVLAEPIGDSVNFQVFLQELPRINKWGYEGTRKGEETDLKGKLRLRAGVQFSDYLIKNSTDIIRKHFIEKGYRNVEISIRQTEDEMLSNAVNLTFVVKRNHKVRIKEIVFEGNELVSDKKLRRSMKKTHQKSINIFRGIRLKDDLYAEDKEHVIDYYNSLGYRNATIVRDSIYPIDDKFLGIQLQVEEGDMFYYRDVTWLGNSVYTTKQLNDILAIIKGDHYDRKTLYKQLGVGKFDNPDGMSVNSLYQNAGYLSSRIEPIEIVVGRDSIDLQIRVFEGRQARINNIEIAGNMRVDDEVIRRELFVRPGELYNRALLMETMRMLGQMRHFSPEHLTPKIIPVTNEHVNLAFALEEIPSDKFEVSGGWGAGMFVGSLGVNFTNFSIKNIFRGDHWTPYPSGRNQSLSLRGQTNGTRYKSFSASFTEPWLGGKKPNSLTIGLYYSDMTDAYSVFHKSNKHFRTLGASVGIGRRLKWPDRHFTLYNELGYQAYNLKDWSDFIVNNGTSNIITLKSVFGRNTLDQFIYPHSGSDFSVSLALTPPYSLFDHLDYSSDKLTNNQRYKYIEFHKWLLKGEWFFPLSNNQKLVLMTRAQMGYLGSYNPHKPSPFEGFKMGGDGMSGYSVYGVDLIAMRGYKNETLIPAGEIFANVYNKYTIEVRYPFISQPSSQIYGLAFAEAGNAFTSWTTFDPFTLKRSLGVGVRVYLSFIGTIGFDWGYGFDHAVGSNKPSGGSIHFMFGQQF